MSSNARDELNRRLDSMRANLLAGGQPSFDRGYLNASVVSSRAAHQAAHKQLITRLAAHEAISRRDLQDLQLKAIEFRLAVGLRRRFG